jgi:hypothetical protein
VGEHTVVELLERTWRPKNFEGRVPRSWHWLPNLMEGAAVF